LWQAEFLEPTYRNSNLLSCPSPITNNDYGAFLIVAVNNSQSDRTCPTLGAMLVNPQIKLYQNLAKASPALNKTAESPNSTLSEFGKNITDAGKTTLNKTVEVANGIGSGAADVLGNISGEILSAIHFYGILESKK
jgi:hypothetical protein